MGSSDDTDDASSPYLHTSASEPSIDPLGHGEGFSGIGDTASAEMDDLFPVNIEADGLTGSFTVTPPRTPYHQATSQES